MHSRTCDSCVFTDKRKLVGDYKILDYEVPSFYYIRNTGLGEIDLIIGDGTKEYAFEIKPERSKETLVRMVSEILTYTLGDTKEKYHRAIVFFEESDQHKQYKEMSPEMKSIFFTHTHGDHIGLIDRIHPSIPLYMGNTASRAISNHPYRMTKYRF